ncbi:cobalamin biosynthesis protein CbiG [Caloramator mitchellensis]|uniref:Cobalamin biosynthesis protein CbiG n=1 Tax=Caloramator mitchellensis TaxID=908809 RepID=A0A0R3JR54_CALMK|nr:cobalt-precorrin 5A hydrolase [Caloramator mitchellensis]KRQ85913.1 cobalamin biosynthesis protein CbiG [Caloramator mitchellensis]
MIAAIYFTDQGKLIADKIKDSFDDVFLFSKHNYKTNLENIFNEFDKIIFISATGIAVRTLAPFIKDKWSDPAVVVVDDLGRYCISLLSGHYGGANEFCNEVAKKINAMPIITTASDSRGFVALDLIAKRYNFYIEDAQKLKEVTASMLRGEYIDIISDVELNIDYPYISKDATKKVVITYREKTDYDSDCILRPRILNVGIGCRRGVSKEKIINAIEFVFKKNNLSIKSIKQIGTVEVKRDEIGLLEFCDEMKLPVMFFTLGEIKSVQEYFEKSSFVENNIGVTSVAEPCAYLMGNEIIVKKTAFDGVTIAVSKEG